ncbi:MAG: hypothetical protein NTV51_31880 [Verrucomicrobia bacterium]|nr:hypothetical protein [Verrucomicrobiota bacterium]
MSLTPEQKAAVSSWVAAGDNLSAVQKKLLEQFKITMTYRDVRFLVDDLNLALKDPAPKVDTSDVSKTPAPTAAEKPTAKARARPAPGATDLQPDAEDAATEDADALPPEDDLEELPAAGPSTVTV